MLPLILAGECNCTINGELCLGAGSVHTREVEQDFKRCGRSAADKIDGIYTSCCIDCTSSSCCASAYVIDGIGFECASAGATKCAYARPSAASSACDIGCDIGGDVASFSSVASLAYDRVPTAYAIDGYEFIESGSEDAYSESGSEDAYCEGTD